MNALGGKVGELPSHTPLSFLLIRSGLLPQPTMQGDSRHLSDEEGVSGCEDCIIVSATCSDRLSDTKSASLAQVLEAVCTGESTGR